MNMKLNDQKETAPDLVGRPALQLTGITQHKLLALGGGGAMLLPPWGDDRSFGSFQTVSDTVRVCNNLAAPVISRVWPRVICGPLGGETTKMFWIHKHRKTQWRSRLCVRMHIILFVVEPAEVASRCTVSPLGPVSLVGRWCKASFV